jgi:AcrR family transcriptional regulator
LPTAVKTKPVNIRRNRQYEKRLASILKAASRIIARDGFEGASIRKVAAKAGIGLSGIYYYFNSKDELLYALQEHAFATLVENLKARLTRTAIPKERLKAVIENHFEYFAGNMDGLKVCVHEIESLSGTYYNRVLKIRREYFEMVRSVVAETTAQAGKRDISLATLFLFGSLNWIYMWYDPNENPDMSHLSDRLLKIYLNGIKAS